MFAADLAIGPVAENPVAAESPVSPVVWLQNPTNRFDVNNDGSVSPIDALVLINQHNCQVDPAQADHYFADVNGDGQFTTNDIETVIGYLNGDDNTAPQPAVPAEGEGVTTFDTLDVDRSAMRVITISSAIDSNDCQSPRVFFF